MKKIPNDFNDYVKDAIENGNTISLIDIMGLITSRLNLYNLLVIVTQNSVNLV